MADFKDALDAASGPFKVFRRTWAALEIRACHASFDDTGNPLFALRAFTVARRAGLALPPWVLEYIDSAFGGLLALADDPPDQEPSRAVAAAMGLSAKGRGSLFSRYKDFHRQLDAALRVRELLAGEEYADENEDSAFRAVAKEINASPSTVRDWYKRFEHDLDEPLH